MRRAVAVLLAATAALLLVFAGTAPASAAPPGPGSAPEYWFDDWDVRGLWASGARGQGVTIAEIDTGVTVLPQLRGRVLAGTDLGPSGGNGQTDREVDEFGHGTAMASIMVGKPGPFGITGIAPGAKVLPIAVPLNGTSDAGAADRLDDGIRYAVDHGAKIVNMSLGGKRTREGEQPACDSDEQNAVYYALSKGAVLVAAAGNSGPDRNTVEDPAVCLGVVVVGAADADGAVARFSTRQPYVTLLAPGVDVPSLGRVSGEAFSGDGTSQAAAITSAALALVWSKYPALSGSQVVARTLATLQHRTSAPTASAGYGVLDAGRAVRASVPATAVNPVAVAVAPFLARYRAGTSAVSEPPPATARDDSRLGHASVGSVPRLTDHRVLLGLAVVVAGLVLLGLAGVLGTRNRRRRGRRAGHEPVSMTE